VSAHKPVVVLVGGDLAARARIADAAGRAGVELVTTTPAGLGPAADRGPELVIVDLDEGGERALAAVAGLTSSGTRPPRVVGYVSHVDRDLIARARAEGIEALPRGRFWRELVNLVSSPARYPLEAEHALGRGAMDKDSRPAAPSQPEEGGFEEGLEQEPDSPAEETEGRFSTGQEERPPPGRKARFSEGEEDLGDTPDKTAERRFSEGQEGRSGA
jgi:hypothetical protein